MLRIFYCSDNPLESLDVSNNPVLTIFYCRNNKFTAKVLNALFHALHNNTIPEGKDIYINGNPGTDGCDQNIAKAKYCAVYVY